MPAPKDRFGQYFDSREARLTLPGVLPSTPPQVRIIEGRDEAAAACAVLRFALGRCWYRIGGFVH